MITTQRTSNYGPGITEFTMQGVGGSIKYTVGIPTGGEIGQVSLSNERPTALGQPATPSEVPSREETIKNEQSLVQAIQAPVSLNSEDFVPSNNPEAIVAAVSQAIQKAEEVTAAFEHNSVAIAGPCANLEVRELLGRNANNCAEGFEPGQLAVKALKGLDGRIEVIIAGATAEDTSKGVAAVGLA